MSPHLHFLRVGPQGGDGRVREAGHCVAGEGEGGEGKRGDGQEGSEGAHHLNRRREGGREGGKETHKGGDEDVCSHS